MNFWPERYWEECNQKMLLFFSLHLSSVSGIDVEFEIPRMEFVCTNTLQWTTENLYTPKKLSFGELLFRLYALPSENPVKVRLIWSKVVLVNICNIHAIPRIDSVSRWKPESHKRDGSGRNRCCLWWFIHLQASPAKAQSASKVLYRIYQVWIML